MYLGWRKPSSPFEDIFDRRRHVNVTENGNARKEKKSRRNLKNNARSWLIFYKCIHSLNIFDLFS